jgi:hypothetical protein
VSGGRRKITRNPRVDFHPSRPLYHVCSSGILVLAAQESSAMLGIVIRVSDLSYSTRTRFKPYQRAFAQRPHERYRPSNIAMKPFVLFIGWRTERILVSLPAGVHTRSCTFMTSAPGLSQNANSLVVSTQQVFSAVRRYPTSVGDDIHATYSRTTTPRLLPFAKILASRRAYRTEDQSDDLKL